MSPRSPVRGGDGVVDRQLAGVGQAAELLQAARPHVGEEQPVSNTELWQEAALHHLVQLVQWRAPKAAGIHGLVNAQRMLEKKHTNEPKHLEHNNV